MASLLNILRKVNVKIMGSGSRKGQTQWTEQGLYMFQHVLTHNLPFSPCIVYAAFKSLRKLNLFILLAETAEVKIPLFRVKESILGARL